MAKIGASPRRRAPVAGGPEVETLTATDGIAVVHMEIPAGGGVPEHDHGPSQVVLVLLSGVVRVTYGGVEHTLEPGGVAHVGTGQRISVKNPGTRTRRADARRIALGLRRPARGLAGRVRAAHPCARLKRSRRSCGVLGVPLRRRSDRALP